MLRHHSVFISILPELIAGRSAVRLPTLGVTSKPAALIFAFSTVGLRPAPSTKIFSIADFRLGTFRGSAGLT